MTEIIKAKERPILMSADNVRAILDGKKTMTRRVIKQAIHTFRDSLAVHTEIAGAVLPACFSGWVAWFPGNQDSKVLAEFTKQQYEHGFLCPYGQVGSRLWVRETFAFEKRLDNLKPREFGNAAEVPTWFLADNLPDNGFLPRGKWRPSIFMPRWASRLTLEIMGIKVERVQEISEEDAIREGYPWASNPWVWCIKFRSVSVKDSSGKRV